MKKHNGGRPTKYEGAKTCAKVLLFAESMSPENFPERCSKASVAVYLGVDEDTILNWEKAHSEFFGAIKTWKTKRDATAFKFRLWGDGRWIFCMKNWTGMTDRQEVAHSGKVETNDPLIIKVVHVKDGDKGNGNGNGNGDHKEKDTAA
jgi:hypothetical protein